MELAFLSPSPMELMVIAVIALIVLGPTRLPDAARSVGKGMREMRDSFSGLTGDDDDDDDAPRRRADIDDHADEDDDLEDDDLEDDDLEDESDDAELGSLEGDAETDAETDDAEVEDSQGAPAASPGRS